MKKIIDTILEFLLGTTYYKEADRTSPVKEKEPKLTILDMMKVGKEKEEKAAEGIAYGHRGREYKRKAAERKAAFEAKTKVEREAATLAYYLNNYKDIKYILTEKK